MDRAQTLREHEAFRHILQAFARPGSVHRLSQEVVDRKSALTLLACSLFDAESTLAALTDETSASVRQLGILTGCRVAAPADADFVLVGTGGASSVLHELRTGTPEFPDNGSTLVYSVDRICPSGGSWTWTGPGIQGSADPLVEGFPWQEWNALREVNSSYPLGLDAVFLDQQGTLMALPRSTRLQEKQP
jgi:alpha-D-ribose 1-methylphosphonate 5-triphosphate synthase subunit PhnH